MEIQVASQSKLLEEKTIKRPFGLYVIMASQLVVIIFLLLGLLEIEFGSQLRELVIRPVYFGYLWLGWVLVTVLAINLIGLIFLRRWAWTFTMILTGFFLLMGIVRYFSGSPNYFNLAVNVIVVFYMNQREVQRPFLRGKDREMVR